MKQLTNCKATQTNIFQQMEIETQRLNHIRRLNTIYYQKKQHEYSFQELQSRNYKLYLNNKEIDTRRKQKWLQGKIDYQNHILMNRLIDVSIKPFKPRISSINDKCSKTNKYHQISCSPSRQIVSSQNYLKRQQKMKIVSENAKMFMKLTTIKSDLMEKLNIKGHLRNLDEMKTRRSPKKIKMMRSFFRKKHGELLFPDSHLVSAEKIKSLQDE